MTFGASQGPPGAAGATDYNALTNKPSLATVATSGSYADLTSKPIRAGTITATILDTSLAVTFASQFPDNAYEVFVQPKASVAVTFFPSGLSTSGFTLNLSAGVNATFSY